MAIISYHPIFLPAETCRCHNGVVFVMKDRIHCFAK